MVVSASRFRPRSRRLTSFPRFIFEVIAWAGLPWVYGGEYDQFSEALTKVVKAWLGVGLRLHFVFDGASA